MTPKYMEELIEGFELEKLHHIGTDGIGYLISSKLNKFDEIEFRRWIKYHLSTCSDESILGYSQHCLYVCQKKL